MGFSMRQAFCAGAAAVCAAGAVAELNADKPEVAISIAVLAGIDIIVAGLTNKQPG
jgi:hypothetical protein